MKIVFIIYIDRSGSTLLANKLNEYENTIVCPEMSYLSGFLLERPDKLFILTSKQKKQLYYDAKNHFQLSKWPIYQTINKQDRKARNIDIFVSLLKKYQEINGEENATIIFKQQFQNKIPLISQYFRKGDIKTKNIIIIRDPRAIYNSAINAKKLFPKLVFNTNPIILANKWNLLKHTVIHPDNLNTLPILYENLIINESRTLSEICQFIGLKGKNNTKNDDTVSRLSPIEKKLHQKAFTPADKTRINAWQKELSGEHISIIQKIIFSNKVSYQKVLCKYSIFKYLFYLIYYKTRIILKIDKY